jgi:hypothetical protein
MLEEMNFTGKDINSLSQVDKENIALRLESAFDHYLEGGHIARELNCTFKEVMNVYYEV